jgi:FkbM family methyltransferase
VSGKFTLYSKGTSLKTAQKIALAKVAYNFVHRTRRIVGKTDRCIVVRGGNQFELDLAEGIDFAIFLRRYEPSTSRALARLIQPETNVLDIGANVGAHTVHMARMVGPKGHVFAFEPTSFAFKKLKRNIEINPDLSERVVATQCFLAPTDGEGAPGAVYSSWPLKGGADLHQKHLGQPMTTDGVGSRSVDAFLAERGNAPIALVKLDVDGYECDVLAGAVHMMRRDRPVFVMELAPYVLEEHGKSLDDLLAYFTPLGYRFFAEDDPLGAPLEINKISHAVRDGASINVVARAT